MKQKWIRRTRLSVCHQLSSPALSDTPRRNGTLEADRAGLSTNCTFKNKPLAAESTVWSVACRSALKETHCFFYEPGNSITCVQCPSLAFRGSSFIHFTRLPPICPRFILILFCHISPYISSCIFLPVIHDSNFVHVYHLPMDTTRPANLILLDLLT